MGRWGRLIGFGVLLCALVVGTFVVLARSSRDEAMFIERVETWHGERLRPRFEALDDDLLIAEGDQACAWLGGQRPALWRTDPELGFYPMLDKYLATTSQTDTALAVGAISSQDVRRKVANTAWDYLCAPSWTVRKPYHALGPVLALGAVGVLCLGLYLALRRRGRWSPTKGEETPRSGVITRVRSISRSS